MSGLFWPRLKAFRTEKPLFCEYPIVSSKYFSNYEFF